MEGGISDNSKRIARNTVLLYFRMLLLMLIGLFTSRVVLQTLGQDDFGTYGVVGGVVTMFTVFTASISTAISRFLTAELGRGDSEKLGRVFATSVVIQLMFCALLLVFTETAGLWFLHHRMDIPEGRMEAAEWVLQCSAGLLMVTLLSVPFNATIIAHEHMKAFAYISVLEAVLKLSVALLLFVSPADKLKTYAVLMLAVAIIVRFAYGAYCRRHFEESRTKLVFDRALVGEMLGFAGWNALSSGVFMFNTQGLNILTNLFFGVVANAARGVAAQVENIVKQFVFNVVNAINPQITKSYVSGGRDYSYSLVGKGMKYSFLIVLFFLVPFIFEADTILGLWLGDKVVPEDASLFTVLTLVCVMLDVMFTTASTIILADGRIRKFYIVISSVSALIFPLVWVAFKLGAEAWVAYVVFISVYVVLDGVKLVLLHEITDYPYVDFFRDVLLRVLGPTVVTIALSALVVVLIPNPSWWRALLTFAVSTSVLGVTVLLLALTPGERAFVLSKLPCRTAKTEGDVS